MISLVAIKRRSTSDTTESQTSNGDEIAASTTSIKSESTFTDEESQSQVDGSERSTSSADRRAMMRKLSTTARMYDVNGDGVLDETEMAMRNLDKSGRGFLTNDKVYKLMREQLATQAKLFQAKRIIFV